MLQFTVLYSLVWESIGLEMCTAHINIYMSVSCTIQNVLFMGKGKLVLYSTHI